MVREKNNEIDSSKQIKRGAIMSYVAIFFNIAAGLVYIPWMIRQIGQSEYGLYSLALTVISFFTMDFGLGEAVARFMSQYNAEGNKQKASEFLGITFKLYIVIDAAIFITLLFVFLFVGNIYTGLTTSELAQFKIVFVIAALYSIASFPFTPLNGVLISNEKFVFYKFTDLLNKVLTVFTMVIVLLLGYRLYALVVVNAIAGLITIALKMNYIRQRKLVSVNFKAKDKTIVRSIFSYSIWTTIIIVSQRFIMNITPTVLAAFAGSVQISLFAIAMTIEGYTWTFANALNGLFLPKVTRMTVHSDESKDVENLMIKVGRIQLVMTGLLIIGFLTMGKEFMILWIGDSFKESYYITMLLIGTGIITLTQQIGNTMLIAINEIRYRAFCASITAGISITISILLSQTYGAIGAGIAILIGNIIGQVIGLNVVYNKVLKINILRFFKECHVKMAFPLIVACIIGYAIQYFLPVQSLLLFLLKACVFGGIYLIIMWFTALNQYEKGLFIEIFRNTKSKLTGGI